MITKKTLYWFIAGVILLIGSWNILSQTFGGDAKADIFMKHFADEFSIALEEKNTVFFDDLGVSLSDQDLLLSDLTLDTHVRWENEFLFFSFLKKSENSSVLETVYGHWNNKTQKLIMFPEIDLGVMNTGDTSVTFTNVSPIAFPIDNLFFLYPGNIEGEISFVGDLVQPGDSFTFTSQKFFDGEVFFLESLKYGFRATVQ